MTVGNIGLYTFGIGIALFLIAILSFVLSDESTLSWILLIIFGIVTTIGFLMWGGSLIKLWA